MQTVSGSLYDHPACYELAFGSDWKAEFDFLTACFGLHATGSVRRVFEPACGTGRLLFRLAKAGYQAAGLDLNPRAVEYCNRRLRRHGLPETAFVGDMADFRLPRKIDAAFNTINSFRHLTDERSARSHLECVARALRKGGIYILGLSLTPTAGRATRQERWSARRGHLQVNAEMRRTGRSPRRREERFAVVYDVYTPTRSFRLAEQLVFRSYTAAQFRRLLGGVGDLKTVAAYDFAYDVEQPIAVGPGSEDVVFVLRKQ